MDGFKGVNDNFGHEAGDQVLIETAKRLKNIIASDGQIGRLGGDEFAIVWPEMVINQAELAIIAQKIIAQLQQPIIFKDYTMRVGSSIGIALAPLNSLDVDELLKFADEALYYSKQHGKGIYTFYT